MDISKYFDLLQKIKFCLTSYCTEKSYIIEKSIAQNHWIKHDFLNQKIDIIIDTFFDDQSLVKLCHTFIASKAIYKKVALIIDDHIIFSGLYSLLFAYVSGYRVEIKCLPFHQTLLTPIVDILNAKNPTISFVNKPTPCDIYVLYRKDGLPKAAQAYFENRTHIICSTQKSIVVIEGNETDQQLTLLTLYMAQFFGLENGNIGKIYVPENYNFDRLFLHFEPYFYFKDFTHYTNQYDYHLATCILQKKNYYTNGLYIFYESNDLFSPISTIAFERYGTQPDLNQLQSISTSYVLKASNLRINTFKWLEQQYIKQQFNQWII